jgi:hypothetical protein
VVIDGFHGVSKTRFFLRRGTALANGSDFQVMLIRKGERQ